MLKYAVANGMIDLSYVQEQIEMNKRKELLKKHQYAIWKGKDGKWYTYLPDEKNRRVLKKRASEEAIKNLVIEYYSDEVKEQNKLKREQDIVENRFDTNFETWKRKQIAYGVSSNTVSKYNSDYQRFFKGSYFEKMDIRNMTEEDITIFIISRIKELDLKEKAGKALWGYISGVFHSAKINKKIVDNPCQYVDTKSFVKFYNRNKRPIDERVLSNDEISIIMKQLTTDHLEKPEYLPSYAVELAIYTGMRTGELAGLKWSDIQLDNRIMIICRSEKYDRINGDYFISGTKTYKSRQFPISDEMIILFRKIIRLQEKSGCYDDFVFSNSEGRIHGRTISDCMRNKCIQTGITVKGVHAIRRTFNSRMRCEGVSSTVAASLLGHTEEVNQQNYTYDITGMEYKREVVKKINESIKGNQGNQNANKMKMAENLDKSTFSATKNNAGSGT
ncbi:site-specific integrase [Acetatifactor muris]|uniref:tyrosine-type recombinase/integrase n=1 Tax=Acetatifactor muris TaxID=879566 RepID=UPI00155883BF|nr:site-specific integrase [Acetatifactor muris]MCR2049716.1 site-specific integrase [Acetatifactor muris]